MSQRKRPALTWPPKGRRLRPMMGTPTLLAEDFKLSSLERVRQASSSRAVAKAATALSRLAFVCPAEI